MVCPGNTKGGSITVWPVLQIKTKIVSCHTADSKTYQTWGQQYSDTSPFSVTWFVSPFHTCTCLTLTEIICGGQNALAYYENGLLDPSLALGDVQAVEDGEYAAR